MVFADLPYGTTECAWDTPINLTKLWQGLKRVCKPNTAQLFTACIPFTITLGASNLANLHYDWVWSKNRASNFASAKRMPLRQHENVLVFYQKQPIYNPQMEERTEISKERYKYPIQRYDQRIEHMDRDFISLGVKSYDANLRLPKTIQHFVSRAKKSLYPTEKPVELIEYFIRTYTNEYAVILDPTFGSGSTAEACLRTKRRFIGCDLANDAYEIALERIKAL